MSLLVAAADSFFAVPLAGRIHEGVKFTNRDHRTLPGKCCDLLDSLALGQSFYFVADAYYACATVAQRLRASGSHLISRVRRNTVAYLAAAAPRGPRKRGRPRVYGKLKLWSLFDSPAQDWQQADSPVYGERGVTIRFLCRDLIWRPLRTVVRFVLVDHPVRGRSIFITTDLSLPPIEVIRLYGLRFKIELSFKHALRVLGAYAYHFWMRAMPKITRRSGTQHLHRASDHYRASVRRKLAAYHRHIQIGLIAQGLLQCLAIQHPRLVWSSFGSWLRTIRPHRSSSSSPPPHYHRCRIFSRSNAMARYSKIPARISGANLATTTRWIAEKAVLSSNFIQPLAERATQGRSFRFLTGFQFSDQLFRLGPQLLFSNRNTVATMFRMRAARRSGIAPSISR
jgi:hypothetical protein